MAIKTNVNFYTRIMDRAYITQGRLVRDVMPKRICMRNTAYDIYNQWQYITYNNITYTVRIIIKQQSTNIVP